MAANKQPGALAAETQAAGRQCRMRDSTIPLHEKLQIIAYMMAQACRPPTRPPAPAPALAASCCAGSVWGDEDDGVLQGPDQEHLEREWRARREEHYSSGYREGLEAGKQEAVQAGFHQGWCTI
jgi:hypothetical protein